MTTPNPSYLRLHTEPHPVVGQPSLDVYRGLAGLCHAFEQAVGWPLRYLAGPPACDDAGMLWSAPLSVGGKPQGHLRIDAGKERAPEVPPCALGEAADLAESLADLLNELLHTQQVVWHREAELAASVPIVARNDEPRRLAERLEAVLRSGAEAIGCHAAALYLLDAQTTELKLRSAWGLPLERLTEPARPLADCTADLEALTGHAVVINGEDGGRCWDQPEPFSAGICLPVSSPTVPLGTLWIFSQHERAFSDAELHLLELLVGRVSVELERQTLLVESRRGARLKNEARIAQQFRQHQLPQYAPLICGWDVAGTVWQPHELGGAFFDWQCNGQDDLFSVSLGTASECGGLAAALVAQGVRASLRAHAEHQRRPNRLLQQVNRSLWTGSAGEQPASLLQASVEPTTGLVSYAWAGCLLALRIGQQHAECLLSASIDLGADPDLAFAEHHLILEAGDILLAFNSSPHEALNPAVGESLLKQLAKVLGQHRQQPAAELAEIAGEALRASGAAASSEADERAVLIVKRAG